MRMPRWWRPTVRFPDVAGTDGTDGLDGLDGQHGAGARGLEVQVPRDLVVRLRSR